MLFGLIRTELRLADHLFFVTDETEEGKNKHEGRAAKKCDDPVVIGRLHILKETVVTPCVVDVPHNTCFLRREPSCP